MLAMYVGEDNKVGFRTGGVYNIRLEYNFACTYFELYYQDQIVLWYGNYNAFYNDWVDPYQFMNEYTRLKAAMV